MDEVTAICIDAVQIQLDLDMRAQSRRRDRCMNVRHCNTEYEVLLVLRGSCEADIGQHNYTLTQGQGAIMAPGCYHIFRTLPGDFDHFCFRFLPEEGELLNALRRQIPDHRVFSSPAGTEENALALYKIFAARGDYWRERFLTRWKLLLLDVLCTLRLGGAKRAGGADFYTHKRATQIDRYIEQNMSGEPGVEDLARELHLSPRQTERVLQEHFGIGFRQKLLAARMDRAAWLLRTTSAPLGVVMSEVGYESVSAFYQAFRRRFGVTPMQYRIQTAGSGAGL